MRRLSTNYLSMENKMRLHFKGGPLNRETRKDEIIGINYLVPIMKNEGILSFKDGISFMEGRNCGVAVYKLEKCSDMDALYIYEGVR